MFNEKIIPFEGTASIRLYQPMDAVKNLLSVRNIPYSEEIWQAESETIPNPWTVILLDDNSFDYCRW